MFSDFYNNMFIDFYYSLYYCSLILAALISIFLFIRADAPFRWLALLVVLTLISELSAIYILRFSKTNSIVYHFFTPIEYFFYTMIYYRFFRNKKWLYFLMGSVICLLLLEVLNTIYLQPLQVDNTNIAIVESIFLVFLSLMLFVNIRTSLASENILKEGVFWFNSIVLIYYTFNILISGFHSFKVYQFQNPPMVIYQINFLLSGLLYLVYSLSIILNVAAKRKTTAVHE